MGGTVHVIATSLEGTRLALEAAAARARGMRGRVVLFVPRASLDPHMLCHGRNEADAWRQVTKAYSPLPSVICCACERMTDIVQLLQSPGLVVIGGDARLWWPTAEQRLAQAFARFGCQVTFAHVPRRRLVPPLGAAARDAAFHADDVRNAV